ANEVLVTKGALQSEVGHLDMLEHEVGSLCDEYAWWKLTRRCWNTHVLAAAIQEEKEIMWPIFVPWNVRYLFVEDPDRTWVDGIRCATQIEKELILLIVKAADLEISMHGDYYGMLEYEDVEIRIKQYFQIQDYALWEVIENGNSWVPIPVTAPESGPSTALKMSALYC
ncbi:hypothetical protein Tco_0641190, partial [Tanacetum coccineum]